MIRKKSMINENGNNLIYIFSTPRAGSTLLSIILSRHDQIYCPPETWLLLPLYALKDEQTMIISRYDQELAKKAWGNVFDSEIINRASKEYAIEAYNSLLSKSTKELIVDKTPRYYQILNWIDELFPMSKKIFLKRNPLDVFASTKQTWAISVGELLGEYLSPHSFDYTVAFTALLSFFDHKSSYRFILKYEDLVTSTYSCVLEICKFLGISYEKKMLDYGTGESTLIDQLRVAKTMGDKKALLHTKPHSQSINQWKNILDETEIKAIILTLGRNIFIELGYEEELYSAASHIRLDPKIIPDGGTYQHLIMKYKEYLRNEGLLSGGIEFTKVSRENTRLRDEIDQLKDMNIPKERNYRVQLGRILGKRK